MLMKHFQIKDEMNAIQTRQSTMMKEPSKLKYIHINKHNKMSPSFQEYLLYACQITRHVMIAIIQFKQALLVCTVPSCMGFVKTTRPLDHKFVINLIGRNKLSAGY
jgi:hypothetical protein